VAKKILHIVPLIIIFSKDVINWSKVTVYTFLMLQKLSLSYKCCSFELCIHQIILKRTFFSTLIIVMFLEHQIIILEWFLKDHVTMKPGVMMLKIQLYILIYVGKLENFTIFLFLLYFVLILYQLYRWLHKPL